MARKSATATTNNNPEDSIQVLKEATCPTANGKSSLGYQVGSDDSAEIYLKLTSNSGGGFFTSEWIGYSTIDKALKAWPKDQPITSMALRSISRGKSANNAGFLCAVLVAEGLLERIPGKTRVHQLAEPSTFLASLSGSPRKKPAAKAKTKPTPKVKAKAKTAPQAKAKAGSKAKTPRKTK